MFSLEIIKKINNECACDNFEYNERKKINRSNININNFSLSIKYAIVYTSRKNTAKGLNS